MVKVYAIRHKRTNEYWSKSANWFNKQHTKTNPRLWSRLKNCETYFNKHRGLLQFERSLSSTNDYEIVTFKLQEVSQ